MRPVLQRSPEPTVVDGIDRQRRKARLHRRRACRSPRSRADIRRAAPGVAPQGPDVIGGESFFFIDQARLQVVRLRENLERTREARIASLTLVYQPKLIAHVLYDALRRKAESRAVVRSIAGTGFRFRRQWTSGLKRAPRRPAWPDGRRTSSWKSAPDCLSQSRLPVPPRKSKKQGFSMPFPRASQTLSRFTVLDLTRVRSGRSASRQNAAAPG